MTRVRPRPHFQAKSGRPALFHSTDPPRTLLWFHVFTDSYLHVFRSLRSEGLLARDEDEDHPDSARNIGVPFL